MTNSLSPLNAHRIKLGEVSQKSVVKKQFLYYTGEVGKVANDRLLLAKVNDLVIEFDCSQTSDWNRRYLV